MVNQAGDPLSNATIALVGNNRTPAAPLPPSYTTTSNAAGGFVFEDVEPNTYRLFARHTGYLEFVFTQPDGKVVIPIARGDRKNLEVKMIRQSFISGRVTDADGEPFPGALVSVFRLIRANRTRQRTAFNPVPAGADGIFSIGNLAAGRYYVAAASPPSLTQIGQSDARGNNGADERYVTTYYPASLDVATAVSVEIVPGAEIGNVDIRMRKAGVFHIYGKIVDPSGATVPTALLGLHVPGVNDPIGGTRRVNVVDGTFAFNGLLPGVYILQAQSGQSRELQGHQTVTITDHDIDDAILILDPALEIPLSVRIVDADPQQAQKIRSSLGRFTLTTSDGLNDNAMAQPRGDGTWLFHSIGPGAYRMGLRGPEGTYVKSIRFGNQDITTNFLDTIRAEERWRWRSPPTRLKSPAWSGTPTGNRFPALASPSGCLDYHPTGQSIRPDRPTPTPPAISASEASGPESTASRHGKKSNPAWAISPNFTSASTIVQQLSSSAKIRTRQFSRY